MTVRTSPSRRKTSKPPHFGWHEKYFDRRVRAVFNDLRRLGFELDTFHPYGNGRYSAGYPDWTIVGDCGILWRELKTETGRLTPDQKRWIERIRKGGGDVDVWRPSDLISGRIAREMSMVAGALPRAT